MLRFLHLVIETAGDDSQQRRLNFLFAEQGQNHVRAALALGATAREVQEVAVQSTPYHLCRG
jgi:alkylhydroperoxidase/carboxymuconolactone decarboxylase family protein YurZ